MGIFWRLVSSVILRSPRQRTVNFCTRWNHYSGPLHPPICTTQSLVVHLIKQEIITKRRSKYITYLNADTTLWRNKSISCFINAATLLCRKGISVGPTLSCFCISICTSTRTPAPALTPCNLYKVWTITHVNPEGPISTVSLESLHQNKQGTVQLRKPIIGQLLEGRVAVLLLLLQGVAERVRPSS